MSGLVFEMTFDGFTVANDGDERYYGWSDGATTGFYDSALLAFAAIQKERS